MKRQPFAVVSESILWFLYVYIHYSYCIFLWYVVYLLLCIHSWSSIMGLFSIHIHLSIFSLGLSWSLSLSVFLSLKCSKIEYYATYLRWNIFPIALSRSRSLSLILSFRCLHSIFIWFALGIVPIVNVFTYVMWLKYFHRARWRWTEIVWALEQPMNKQQQHQAALPTNSQ